MSKKSSKTSHVLNLLTNRTGALIQDGGADNDKISTQKETGESERTIPSMSGDFSCKDSSGDGSIGSGLSSSSSSGSDSVRCAPSNGSSSGDGSIGSGLSGSSSSGSDSVISTLSGGEPLRSDSSYSSSRSEPTRLTSNEQQTDELPNPVLVEIAAPVRVAVSNPIIAELTRDYPLSSVSVASGCNAESNGHNSQEKTQRKDPSVADLIRTELERNYQNEQQTLPQEELAVSLEQPIPPETPQPSAERQVDTKGDTVPPHIEEFTPNEFLADEFPETKKTRETERIGNEEETGDSGKAENEEEMGDSERIGNEKVTEAPEEANDSFQPCYINVMDEIVRSNVIPIMESMEMCTCSRCVNDVAALALNLLPPKYVVTEKGSLYAKVSLYEGQHRVDVFASITKACLEVKNSPRHHCSS